MHGVIPEVFTEVDAVDVAVFGVVVGKTVDVDVTVAVIKHCNELLTVKRITRLKTMSTRFEKFRYKYMRVCTYAQLNIYC